jgi:hypothetical protein
LGLNEGKYRLIDGKPVGSFCEAEGKRGRALGRKKHLADLKKLLGYLFPMKYHLVTFAVLMIALAFYALGYSSLGGLAFAIGAVFELWFWVRLFRSS